jgi:16S rRNA (cytosine967-C5)-methyltransferase
VLRTESYLEERITALAARGAWGKEPRTRAHLLMAAYSMAFLDRVPVFAAVSEGVAGVRAGNERAGGFANAVLRKLAAAIEKDGRPALADAIAASAPGWLRGALRRSIGRGGAAAFLAAGPVPPPIGLCVAPGEDRAAWIAKIQEAAPNASVTAGDASPHAILVRGAGDVRKLPGAGAAWIVQEEGAQVVTLAAEAKPGDRVLDACAGHGNKTWLLARLVGEGGAVDASDLHSHKLAELRAAAFGARVRATYANDWTTGAGDVPEGYDLVLVDAPCSGVGTLRRRPEIGRRREPADLARLAALQESIARRAATRARDGGRLVYAVCSVLREEAEEVISRLTDTSTLGVRLEPTPFAREPGQTLSGKGHMLRVLPHLHGTDGYFVANLTVRRRGEFDDTKSPEGD